MAQLGQLIKVSRPGPEWFTAAEASIQLEQAESSVRYRFGILVKQGKMEMTKGRPAYFRVKR